MSIIDQQAEGANTSRAAVVHARTLEALEQIGVAERLNACGVKCATFSFRDRDNILLAVDVSHLHSRYPYTLMISRATTESILLERLTEAGAGVMRPCALANLYQDANGVDVKLEDGRRLRTPYVVGAGDAAHVHSLRAAKA